MRFDGASIKRMFEEYRGANHDSSNAAVRRFRSFKSVGGVLSASPQYLILLFACRSDIEIRELYVTDMMRDLVIGDLPYRGLGSTIHADGRENYLRAFHYAVQCNNSKAVELFLRRRMPASGVEVSMELLVNTSLVRDADLELGVERCRWTPLMTAAYLGHKDMVKTLIWRGADVFNRGSVRPVEVGEIGYRCKRQAVVGVGERREVDAIELAKQAGHAEIFKILLDEAASQQKAATDIQRMVRGVGDRSSLVKVRDGSTAAGVELSAVRLWQKPNAPQKNAGTQTGEFYVAPSVTHSGAR